MVTGFFYKVINVSMEVNGKIKGKLICTSDYSF